MNSMKRQNDRILKGELPGSVGAQYATGYQWRNNSRKNEGMESKHLDTISAFQALFPHALNPMCLSEGGNHRMIL